MVPPEEKQPALAAEGEVSPPEAASPAPETPAEAPYQYYDDSYGDYGESSAATAPSTPAESPSTELAPAAAPPPPPAGPETPKAEEDDDEEGMARMSFLEHLDELRRRLLYALGGLLVAFALSLTFASKLWGIVSQPAVSALKQLKVEPPELVYIQPLEYFNIVWLKLPLLSAVFLASPWILYQVWGFIAPGLYRRERRWASPFVLSTAGLFCLGGVFGYFVVFRYALVFLLGLGIGNNARPMVSVDAYFSIFVNVMLGIGIVFELPVLIFFLALIRVVTARFLLRNVRYAILAIFAIAAIVTPTPDVFNLVLFAMPMCGLFFVGIAAAWILEMRREERRFPWAKALTWAGGVLALVAAAMYYLHLRFGYHFVRDFPWWAR